MSTTFDLDKSCREAMRAVLDRIDDVHTINRWAIGRDFAAARDHMLSRHRHQRALSTNLREVRQ